MNYIYINFTYNKNTDIWMIFNGKGKRQKVFYFYDFKTTFFPLK